MKFGKWRAAWMVCGLISVICAALNPYVGWYAAGNLAVFGSGFYVIKEARSRTRRLLENRQLLKKMSKHDKEKFISLDRQETKNIQAMSGMMLPVITVCNVCLNVYCYIYYSSAHRIVLEPMASLADNTPLCVGLLVIDALSAVLFLLALRKDVDLIMKEPETIYLSKKKQKEAR